MKFGITTEVIQLIIIIMNFRDILIAKYWQTDDSNSTDSKNRMELQQMNIIILQENQQLRKYWKEEEFWIMAMLLKKLFRLKYALH